MPLKATTVHHLCSIFLLLVSTVYLLLCPYNKVEESFATQAAHDLYYYGLSDITKFDHLRFPGVVPRSFAVPCALAYSVRVLLTPIQQIQHTRPLHVQLFIRFLLLLFNWVSLVRLSYSIQSRLSHKYSKFIGVYFLLITSVQFHIPYYCSRLLGNSVAMGFVNCAFASWLDRNAYKALGILVFTAVAIRCDVCILIVSMGSVMWLITGEVRLLRSFKHALYGLGAGLIVSMPIDSYLWQQRFMVPELQVLLFNTVENKSSDWGVMPWHWYGSYALPRVFLLTFTLIPVGLFRLPEFLLIGPYLEKRKSRSCPDASSLINKFLNAIDLYMLPIVIVPIGFVLLFSFLPHKEVRFLFPIISMFNLSAAIGLCRLQQTAQVLFRICNHRREEENNNKMNKHYILKFLGIGCVIFSTISLMLTFVGTIVFVLVSASNYPGAYALQRLSLHLQSSLSIDNITGGEHHDVYIDVAASMAGVSLFLQKDASYNLPHNHSISVTKEGYENSNAQYDPSVFSYLITEETSLDAEFNLLEVVRGQPKFNFRGMTIEFKPTLYIWENKLSKEMAKLKH